MGDESELHKNWENVALRHVNEQLLSAGGGSWASPPARGWLDLELAADLRPTAKRVLDEEFPDGDVAVWKDPRTCLTLPFWIDLLGEPYFVVIHRHPTEVAASLTTRNNFGVGLGYALWERYNADALAAMAGRPAIVLDYATVVEKPIEALGQVRSALAELGVELPNDPATTDHGLVAQERHHTAESADALDPIATPSQIELYTRLRHLEGAHTALPGPADPPAQSPLSVELLELVGKVRRSAQARKRSRAIATGAPDRSGRLGRSERRKRRQAADHEDSESTGPTAAEWPGPA
jgi:hypothetical protein